MSEQATIERWVMTRGMHLGFIKATLSAGTVIEHNLDDRFIKAEGRKYDCDSDLDILKRHGWVVPFSEEVIQQIIEQGDISIKQEPPEDNKIEPMKVVQSDEDLMGDHIDISHTVTANRNASKEDGDNDGKLEVIKGDEDPADRVARLESTIPKMKIVKDDSLGYGDSKATSMNSGKVGGKKLSVEEIETIRQENLAKTGIIEVVDEQRQIAEDHTAVTAGVEPKANAETAEQHIARLEAELASVKSQIPAPTETATDAKITTVDANVGPKRGRGRPKGAKNKKTASKKITRVPVSKDEAVAE